MSINMISSQQNILVVARIIAFFSAKYVKNIFEKILIIVGYTR